MKISRLALAVALALGGTVAHAQSNVTLYGILDAGYLLTNPAKGSNTSELVDGIQSQSRFGIRGSEKIGTDLVAAFTLEGGISVDTGQSQQNGRLFGRQAWLSLGNQLGEVRLGRQYGIGYEYFLSDTSPFGTTFRDAGSGAVFSSAAGRLIFDNVIMLRSANYAGFSGAVGYSFQPNGTEQPGTSNNVGTWTAGLRYTGSGFYLAASYENFNCPSNSTGTTFNTCNAVTQDNQSQWQLGGSVEVAMFRFYGMWSLQQNQFNFFAVTPAKKAQAYEVGAKMKLFGGEVLAAYQGRNDDFDANVGTWGLGYTYPLSRRTNLYTFVSDTSADDNPQVQVVSGGRIVREGYTPSQIDAYRALDRVQFGLGIRHLF